MAALTGPCSEKVSCNSLDILHTTHSESIDRKLKVDTIYTDLLDVLIFQIHLYVYFHRSLTKDSPTSEYPKARIWGHYFSSFSLMSLFKMLRARNFCFYFQILLPWLLDYEKSSPPFPFVSLSVYVVSVSIFIRQVIPETTGPIVVKFCMYIRNTM